MHHSSVESDDQDGCENVERLELPGSELQE
jgi:hypothetical protein